MGVLDGRQVSDYSGYYGGSRSSYYSGIDMADPALALALAHAEKPAPANYIIPGGDSFDKQRAINDGSNCPALYIMTETDKGDGSAPSVGIKGSPAKDWLDAENAEALNEPLPATAPLLNDAQQKIGTDALFAINNLLVAMAPDKTTHRPDPEKFQAAADKLHQLFGGKESPEFYKPISEYVNYMLKNGPEGTRSNLVRVGTSEITGQTFIGFSNTVSNKFAPFIQLGGVADCSQFKG